MTNLPDITAYKDFPDIDSTSIGETFSGFYNPSERPSTDNIERRQLANFAAEKLGDPDQNKKSLEEIMGSGLYSIQGFDEIYDKGEQDTKLTVSERKFYRDYKIAEIYMGKLSRGEGYTQEEYQAVQNVVSYHLWAAEKFYTDEFQKLTLLLTELSQLRQESDLDYELQHRVVMEVSSAENFLSKYATEYVQAAQADRYVRKLELDRRLN